MQDVTFILVYVYLGKFVNFFFLYFFHRYFRHLYYWNLFYRHFYYFDRYKKTQEVITQINKKQNLFSQQLNNLDNSFNQYNQIIREYIEHQIRLILLQKELLYNFPEYKRLHIFWNKSSKLELCDHMMTQNNDFVFKLIEAFKFSNIEVAQKSIIRLSESNNLEQLEQVIKNVRKWFKKDQKSVIENNFEKLDQILLQSIDLVKKYENGTHFCEMSIIPEISIEENKIKGYILINDFENALTIAQESSLIKNNDQILQEISKAQIEFIALEQSNEYAQIVTEENKQIQQNN